MTSALARVYAAGGSTPAEAWRLMGWARIDDRPPVRCELVVRSDGAWSARLALFTFADTVDLFFEAGAGGQFCGPAFVERSRADSYPFAMATELSGVGPLLIAKPGDAALGIGDVELVDGEVVDE